MVPSVARGKRRLVSVAAAVLLGSATVALAAAKQDSDRDRSKAPVPAPPASAVLRNPQVTRLVRAIGWDGDVRSLPQVPPERLERPERERPEILPRVFPGTPAPTAARPSVDAETLAALSAPAPSPTRSFEGMSYAANGNGHPPDTNGDVGPHHFIQSINTSIAIYRKTDGVALATFGFNTFMSQGHFGNVCDNHNFGDPVVLYDSFEDRWVITDFAFQLNGSGDVINPPGAFECIAVSRSGDPVSGGWNFYSVNTTGGLGDYPKLGIWPDGLYLSVNLFGYRATDPYLRPRLYAFNKKQMYAGVASPQVVLFDMPAEDFTVLPANARLQLGTPPAGAPNYFVELGKYFDAISVFKFHVDWTTPANSTLTGEIAASTATDFALLDTGAGSTDVSSPVNPLDSLAYRTMMQNQYTNIGGVESLWNVDTVGAGNPLTSGVSSSTAAPRFYQVTVTGGVVAPATVQAFTFSPDARHRFVPSVAVDRAGNMAMGYSVSSGSLNPALRYAGRLATDPPNAITQTETSLIEGGGTQSGTCGGSTCTRWGDYSTMTVDPDGCTFWFTSEYYATTGLNHHTRIGAFAYPSCVPTDDLIYKNAFDTCDLSGWSTTATDGGDLSASPAAAMSTGPCGLLANVNDTSSLYVEDDNPSAENRYRVRFYINPHDFNPGTSLGHFRTRVFIAFQQTPQRRLLAVVLKFQNGQYSLLARVRQDSGALADTAFVPISAAPHAIELELRRATGPATGDGSLQMWIDGTSVAALTALANNASGVDFARLGALSVKAGSSGSLYFDSFESRRVQYIGP